MSIIGSQVPVPKVLGMKRVMSVDDNAKAAKRAGVDTPESSTHGTNQAYHLLQRTPSWTEAAGARSDSQAYGAAFQLVQEDGSRRGSSQAYHLLKVAQNGTLNATAPYMRANA